MQSDDAGAQVTYMSMARWLEIFISHWIPETGMRRSIPRGPPGERKLTILGYYDARAAEWTR